MRGPAGAEYDGGPTRGLARWGATAECRAPAERSGTPGLQRVLASCAAATKNGETEEGQEERRAPEGAVVVKG